MLILPALGVINAIYHGRMLQHYVRHPKRIDDMAGLARFQKIVARQMYAALAQLLLLIIPIILYFIAIPTEILRFADIVYVMFPGAVLMAIGYHFKKVETQVCRIPALGEDLDEQRLAIIKRWRTRAVPDW